MGMYVCEKCMTQFELEPMEFNANCISIRKIHSLLANCHRETFVTFTHSVTRTFGSRKRLLKKD